MKETRIDAQTLKTFAQELLERLGFPAEDAAVEADQLVWANLRGVDSHGVLRLPWIAEQVQAKQFSTRPDIRIVRETAAILVIDGDYGLGAVTATFAMKRAIEKARQVGIGWALLAHTVTPLAIGYFTRMAAEADMIGLAATVDRPNLAPHGAKASGLHNGPISIAVPAKRHRPVLLDMATSVAAWGKVAVAMDKGIEIPEGWALDKDGRSTTDPHQVRILLPFGGYKGSDLSFMLECMSSILAGDPRAGPTLSGKGDHPRHRQSSIMAAIDIATFADVEWYKEQVDELIDGVKGLPAAEGCDEVLVAGEPEDRTAEDRARHGIPLPEGTVSRLRDAAKRVDMQLPFG
ncbi:MAG: Ldh family oxidoreductase [Anaerolineae bacterium]|nr:Ldh family oxidoreductase [Anaerolineae bacterium]